MVDHGSYQIRAGHDGDSDPIIIFPSVVGTPHLQGSHDLRSYYVGDEALTKRDILNLRYPINRELFKTGMIWKRYVK